MNARLLGLAMVVGLSLPVAAQAQMLAPGLWELTTSNMKVDNQDLPDLSLEEMNSVHPGITQEIYSVLGVENSVRSRTSYGGTAPDQVRAQVARWKQALG